MGNTASLIPHLECGQCTTVLEGGTDKDRSPGMAMVSLISIPSPYTFHPRSLGLRALAGLREKES